MKENSRDLSLAMNEPRPAVHLSAPEWFCLAAVILSLTFWSGHLLPAWLHNPDLSHGLLTPVIFVLLVREGRLHGAKRTLPEGAATLAGIATALLAGLSLLALGGLYAAALGWTHALVNFLIAAALCMMLVATWINFARESVQLVPFNWPAGVAILVWFLSAPVPPGTYTNLTQTLQNGVTGVVVRSLQLFGIAALKNGNVVELANVSVGVEEACSGIRSLISCLFAAFFFSAVLLRSPRNRAVVILLAGPLAVTMNALRSLGLTLLANAGVEIRGAWHDFTSYAILVITAAVLAGLAMILESAREKRAPPHPKGMAPGGVFPAIAGDKVIPTSRWAERAQPLLATGWTLAATLSLFFILKTRPAAYSDHSSPNLAALLPASFPSWQVVTNRELYRFSSELQTDWLFQRTYARETDQGPLQITVYAAYWPAGQAPVSLVAAHTPDACWPGTGWMACPTIAPRAWLEIDGRKLPEAEYRLFGRDGYPQHVWYWHFFDGHVILQEGAQSPQKLLWLAWRYGFRREGEQLFVRISSNYPWESLAREPLLAEIFMRFRPLGF